MYILFIKVAWHRHKTGKQSRNYV